MICKYCKARIDDGSTHCPHCDRALGKLPLGGRILSSLKQMPKRYWLCVSVLLIALVIAVSVFFITHQPDPYLQAESTVSVISDGEGAQLYYNGKPLEGEYSATLAKLSASFDGAEKTFIQDGALYLATGKGVRLVTDSVTHYQLNPDGDYIAYINSVGELYRYKCSSGKATLIDYNVLASNLCISHDGTLAYIKQETGGDVMYYCTGKKPQKYADQDRYAISVSNGAKHIYTVDGSMNLYYRSGKKEIKLGDKISATGICLNSTGTDILYVSGGATYVYNGKGEARLIAETVITPVRALHTAEYVPLAYLADDSTQIRLGIDDFADKFYVGEKGSLYYLDKKYQTRELATAVKDVITTVDGSQVFYQSADTLDLVKSNKNGKTTLIASAVSAYAVSKDGRYVYYTTSDGTLYCKHGRLSAKELAKNVGTLALSGEDYLFYTVNVEDGIRDLYAVKGRSGTELVCAQVSEYRVGAGAAYYVKDGVRYFSKADMSFKQR